MGAILGGGGSGGGSSGGGDGPLGFLGGLLGGLPDPLGLGKMLGITKPEQKQDPAMGHGGAPTPPLPAGVQYAQQQQPSGVSYDPTNIGQSPMGPTGFQIGGGVKR